jgi:hypothetical protein
MRRGCFSPRVTGRYRIEGPDMYRDAFGQITPLGKGFVAGLSLGQACLGREARLSNGPGSDERAHLRR